MKQEFIKMNWVPLMVLCFLSFPVWEIYCQSMDPHSPYKGYQTEYTRPDNDLDLNLDEPVIAPNPLGGPEQVFLNQGDNTGTAFTVSWSSNISMESVVLYSKKPGKYELEAYGNASRYKYADYESGFLHHVTLSGLKYGTKYYYKIGRGDDELLTFSSYFITPPAPGPKSPFKFSIVGDLGQTYSSNITLSHIIESGGEYLLNVGDFSYADGYQPRWDTWGRMMSKLTSKVPMVFTYGNHELEFDPEVKNAVEPHEGFLATNTRFSAPWQTSGGVSPIYYSCNVGPAHIISLNSYIAITKYSPQYEWLVRDLQGVNRSVTPWVFIITHVPWYNTYNSHYLEGEAIRTAVEYFARKYKVDAIFAGHVHAYERFKRAYMYHGDECAPLYITIGDGGNREGPSTIFHDNPQPQISIFREGSFGYGTIEIFNESIALWQWHRNENRSDKIADQFVLKNLGNSNDKCSDFEVLEPVQPYYSLPIESI